MASEVPHGCSPPSHLGRRPVMLERYLAQCPCDDSGPYHYCGMCMRHRDRPRRELLDRKGLNTWTSLAPTKRPKHAISNFPEGDGMWMYPSNDTCNEAFVPSFACIFEFAGCSWTSTNKQKWLHHFYEEHATLSPQLCIETRREQAAVRTSSDGMPDWMVEHPANMSKAWGSFGGNVNFSNNSQVMCMTELLALSPMPDVDVTGQVLSYSDDLTYRSTPKEELLTYVMGFSTLHLWLGYIGSNRKQFSLIQWQILQSKLQPNFFFNSWEIEPEIRIYQDQGSSGSWILCSIEFGKSPKSLSDSDYGLPESVRGAMNDSNFLLQDWNHYPDSQTANSIARDASSYMTWELVPSSVASKDATKQPLTTWDFVTAPSSKHSLSQSNDIFSAPDHSSTTYNSTSWDSGTSHNPANGEAMQNVAHPELVDAVFQFTLTWFKNWINNSLSAAFESNPGDQETGQSSSSSRGPGGVSAGGRKRQIQNSGGQRNTKIRRKGSQRDEDGDDDERNTTQQNILGSLNTPKQTYHFPCPCYLQDRDRYGPQHTCARCWPDIHRLKEHIYRVHGPHECGRCFKKFKDEESLRDHQSVATCLPRRRPRWVHVITKKQKDDLKTRTQYKANQIEEARRISSILFPNSSTQPDQYAHLADKCDRGPKPSPEQTTAMDDQHSERPRHIDGLSIDMALKDKMLRAIESGLCFLLPGSVCDNMDVRPFCNYLQNELELLFNDIHRNSIEYQQIMHDGNTINPENSTNPTSQVNWSEAQETSNEVLPTAHPAIEDAAEGWSSYYTEDLFNFVTDHPLFHDSSASWNL